MISNQIGIITGISSGIGFYLALHLSKKNIIFGILRNKNKFLENLKNHSLDSTENLKLIQMDVRDYKKAKDLIYQIHKQYKKIDFLVNNAGYGYYGAFEELKDKDFREQFETNFFAPLEWIRLVLPIMRKSRAGKILNITSILGRLTIPTSSAYSSSKFSLVAISEILSYELYPFNIQVCSVEPGLIKTDFKKNMKLSENLDDTDSPYDFLNQIIKKEMISYPRFTTDSKSAALKIINLLKKTKLPVHYRIGWDAKLYWFLKNILPENSLNYLIKKYILQQYKKYESKKNN